MFGMRYTDIFEFQNKFGIPRFGMPIGIIILFRMSFVDPPPNLTNALPFVYISFIWVNEYFLYQILSSQYYEQIYLKMTFSHVFFF